jgi:predicted SAM-dependent methyltransferase
MKLHLGCGKRNFEGWTNVDLANFPHIHYQTSVDDLHMIANNSCEVIYSSHTIEYFCRNEINNVLGEWHRVLKPGGTLRVAVPDFDALIKVYRETGNLSLILGPLYGKMKITTDCKEDYIFHKTVYNFSDLKTILESNGFGDVHQYDWRVTEHSMYDDHSQAYMPHMDKENGLLLSLNVEAIKC